MNAIRRLQESRIPTKGIATGEDDGAHLDALADRTLLGIKVAIGRH
jgi:hypothetical protein